MVIQGERQADALAAKPTADVTEVAESWNLEDTLSLDEAARGVLRVTNAGHQKDIAVKRP